MAVEGQNLEGPAPRNIPADHRVTPADIAAWERPEAKVTTRTPRVGREKEWFELTGEVVLVKADRTGTCTSS
jgi:hypothetical protein